MQNNKSNMIVYRMPYDSVTTSHPKSIFRSEKTIEIPESDYVLLFGYIQFPKYLYDLAKTLPLDDKHNESTDTSIKTDDFTSLKSCIAPIDESSYDFKKNVEKLYLTKQ